MRQDYLRDDNGELIVLNGDYVIGPSDQQHVVDIVETQQGEYKEFPLIGFGAINYIKKIIVEDEFKSDLKEQLSYDGYQDAIIDLSQGIENLKIEI